MIPAFLLMAGRTSLVTAQINQFFTRDAEGGGFVGRQNACRAPIRLRITCAGEVPDSGCVAMLGFAPSGSRPHGDAAALTRE